MAKRTLAEAAQEILGANLSAKMGQGEPFGAGKTASGVMAPGQTGKAQDMGGPVASATDSGVAAAVARAPRATPPGATPPVGAEGMKNLMKGEPGKDRAKANASGIVEEEEEEDDSHSNFSKDTTHKIDTLGEEEEEEGYGKKRRAMREEEEEEEEGRGSRRMKMKKNMREEEELEEDAKEYDNEDLDKRDLGQLAADHDTASMDAGMGYRGGGGGGPVKRMQRIEKHVLKKYGKDAHERLTSGEYARNPDHKDLQEEEGLGLPEVQPVSDRVKSYVKGKTGVNVAEDIEAIFAGEELSEAFMKKARKIYEAAVIATAITVCEEIESEYAETLEIVAEQLQEEMTEKVDDYLNYMVEEWVRENEIAIETGLKAELTEDFITGLRNLFVEHYIDIPEEKVNVVEELAKKVEELEESLNEEIQRGVSLKKQLSEQTRHNILRNVAEGLTETQVEKLNSLAEGVEFTTSKEFKNSLITLRESYFPTKSASKKQVLEEEVNGDGSFEEEKKISSEMDQYVKAISKTRPV